MRVLVCVLVVHVMILEGPVKSEHPTCPASTYVCAYLCV